MSSNGQIYIIVNVTPMASRADRSVMTRLRIVTYRVTEADAVHACVVLNKQAQQIHDESNTLYSYTPIDEGTEPRTLPAFWYQEPERQQIIHMFRMSLDTARISDLAQKSSRSLNYELPVEHATDSAYVQGRLNALRDVAKLLKIDLPEPEDQDPTSQNPRSHRTETP